MFRIRSRSAAALLTAAAVILSAAGAAQSAAASSGIAGAEGSVTIELQYDGQPVTGGSFAIWLVGTASSGAGETVWVLTDSFAQSGVDLMALFGEEDPEQESASAEALLQAAETLADEAEAAGTQPLAAADAAGGTVVFPGLGTGVYLVVQTAESEGFASMGPFLFTVPYTVGSGEDAVQVYDVNASGKFTPVRTPEDGLEEEGTEEENEGEEEEAAQEESRTEALPEEAAAALQEEEADAEAAAEETAGLLAQTGQLFWPVPILAACGAGLVLAGRAIRRKEGHDLM